MVDLTVIKGGINRQRTKTGSRSDSLYDALNCYVTSGKTVVVRPGSFRNNPLPPGTKGLTALEGKLHVFAISASIVVSDPYVLHVITHPGDSDEAGDDIELQEIHFAEPFLGFLYVVAEFVNGEVFHYWLRSSGTWQADRIYKSGDVIEPTTPNGLAFMAKRVTAAFPSWAANVPRTEGDIIEPTVYNNYYYTVVDTLGDNPASGSVEPIWPESTGALVIEETDGSTSTAPTTTPPPSDNSLPEDVLDRYRKGSP